MKRILVVEDDLQIAHILTKGLTYKGFKITVVSAGEEALASIRKHPQDLIILDVMLPSMNGFELCRKLRPLVGKTFPILMLTARDHITDKIAGLDCGADDYITKPFDFDELLARIRASLRRSTDGNSFSRRIEVGDVILDLESRQAWRDDHPLELTKREYDLLELLAENAGHVLTKERIFERVWGYDNEAGLEVIKVYMNYLRSKLNIEGKENLIYAVRGVGYVLRA